MEKLVYLLEDDDAIRELVKCTLQLNDIECLTFGTVAEFEAAGAHSLPRSAVMAIMLGAGNGLEVIARLKERQPEIY